MWANPTNIPVMMVEAEAMAGLAPPFPPGYNGTAILVGNVTTNPNGWNAMSPVPIVTHVHGAEVPSGSDGGPNEWFTPNGLHGPDYYTYEPTANNSAVYYYPNEQNEATLWYHDHAMGATRINVFSGLAGYYILTDPADTLHASIPAAFSVYDVPIAIQDRAFYADGSFRFDVDPPPNPDVHPYWVPEYFGDTFMVNGKTWPYLNVSQTLYRFRLLDGCNARFLDLTLVDLDNANATVPFTVIARDQGYLNSSVTENNIVMGPGMRAEILVDFTGIPAGHRILMKNSANAPYPNGGAVIVGRTDEVMQFVVQGVAGPAYSPLPATLNPTLTGSVFPTISTPTVERVLTLTEVMGMGGPLEVLIDGQGFDNAIAELPVEGTTEIWRITNPTADAHPMHWHLVQFQLLSRQPFNTTTYLADWEALNGPAPLNHPTINVGNLASYYTGPAVGPNADEKGWLDTVTMLPGEVSTIIVRYKQQSGQPYVFDPTVGQGYVFHCHIVDHEDNDMMRPYKVITKGQLPPIFDAVKGINGLIYYRIYDHGTSTWSAWSNVPNGATNDTPACVSLNGKLYFAVKGSDGASIWFSSLTLSNSSFSGWTWIDGSTPNEPRLVTRGSAVMLIVRGFNNMIWAKSYNTTTSLWGTWSAIPGGETSDAPAASVIGDVLHLAVKGYSPTDVVANNTLYHGSYNLATSIFSGWSVMGGSTAETPELVEEQATNALWLVVTGMNSTVFTNRWNGVAWEGWSHLPDGVTNNGPAAVILNDDIYYSIVGTDPLNTIFHAQKNLVTGVFSGWTPQAGSSVFDPTLSK